MTKTSVTRPHELGERELNRWRKLQLADERLANPFLAPEFTLAVGRGRPQTRVGVLEDGRGVAGFFPYEHGMLGIGRAVGVGVADCQGLIHAPDLHWDARELTAACGLSVWEFDHLLAYQAPFADYHVVSELSPVIDVTEGFERYTAERPSLERQLRRSRRLLEREVGQLAFDFDVRDMESLRTLIRWKSAQYRRTGRFDRFAKRSILQLVEDLMETRAEGCTGILSMLYAGGRPVAAHFGLRSKTVLCSWFPAFDFDFSRYRPGLLLLRMLVEQAAAQGLAHIDLGKGHEQYKQDFKTGDLAVAEGWVERRTSAALLRRMTRAPRRYLMDFVLSRPTLRRGARRALRGLGYVRTMG